MPALVDVIKALGDESRLRIVAACAGGELCVCQIVELLDLAPSTVSKHLFILRQAGLLEARKDGRWMHYRLAGDDAPPAVREAIAWVVRRADEEKWRKADAARLCCILEEDPEAICRRQRGEATCCAPAPARATNSSNGATPRGDSA